MCRFCFSFVFIYHRLPFIQSLLGLVFFVLYYDGQDGFSSIKLYFVAGNSTVEFTLCSDSVVFGQGCFQQLFSAKKALKTHYINGSTEILQTETSSQ